MNIRFGRAAWVAALLALCASAALMLGGSAAPAQSYPSRQITLVVPLRPADRPISSAG